MIRVEPLPKLFRAGRSRALPSGWIHNQEIRGHSAATALEAPLLGTRGAQWTTDNISAPSSQDRNVTFVISGGSTLEAGSAAGPHPAAMSEHRHHKETRANSSFMTSSSLERAEPVIPYLRQRPRP